MAEDIPLGQVKIGELPAWLGRRSKDPRDMVRAVSRQYWSWCKDYQFVQQRNLVWYTQFMVLLCGFFYFLNYPKIKHHLNAKYHW